MGNNTETDSIDPKVHANYTPRGLQLGAVVPFHSMTQLETRESHQRGSPSPSVTIAFTALLRLCLPACEIFTLKVFSTLLYLSRVLVNVTCFSWRWRKFRQLMNRSRVCSLNTATGRNNLPISFPHSSYARIPFCE